MPQPLTKNIERDGSPDAITRAPELALDIAVITTFWSRVDQQLGLLLAHCLRSSAAIGVEMYNALSSSASQQAVLRAVVSRSLLPDELAAFEKVMKIVKVARSQRNIVVHGIWVYAPSIPDGLILIDTAKAMEHESWAHGLVYTAKIYNSTEGHPGPRNWAYGMIYKHRDFKEIKLNIGNAVIALCKFVDGVKERNRQELLEGLGPETPPPMAE